MHVAHAAIARTTTKPPPVPTKEKKRQRRRPVRTPDTIPIGDLFAGRVSDEEKANAVACLDAVLNGPRTSYGSLRSAFEAVMHAAAYWPKMPWAWFDWTFGLSWPTFELPTFEAQLAQWSWGKGARHLALSALGRGLELREVRVPKGKDPDVLMWAARLDAITILRAEKPRVFDADIERALGRYELPGFARAGMSYVEIAQKRPGGGPGYAKAMS